ncbi:YkgJ family cysteine cluster protein [Paraburkholderia mimosarum]|uniref:YkgJ family cysteine cluster protein n=1 Tax=Paraburkholderia mimosarum TaxID=312026 RepID=UPI0003FB5BA8|nr:YkgJ family cysteine cluster protein [Paraburkholderia mimosarum]
MNTPATSPELAQHGANVAARWRELESGKLARVIEIVNEGALPIKRRHHETINRVINNPAISTDAKIEALWRAVDQIGALAAPHSACRSGCSHCCHTAVLLPPQEAALIGRRIGVEPAKVTGVTQREDVRAGYDNPCPFLSAGACSIYESRPLACRQQYNMDGIDALLCELVGDEPTKVPYLKLLDYHTALVMMCIKRSGGGRKIDLPSVGDIREFFPHGKS